MDIHQLIILGSGPAGYTAAIYAARANLFPVIITGNQIGGQLTQTNNIENWPGNYPNITGSQLMDNLYNHAMYYNTKIIHDNIIQVMFDTFPFILQGENDKYLSKSLIIATGSYPKKLGLLSEKKFFGKGVSTCAICDGLLYRNQKVAVIGGGNSALEEALYLSNIASEVHLIHRKTIFTADNILIKKINFIIKNKKNIFLHQPYIVKNIIGDINGVTGIHINHIKHIKDHFILKLNAVFILIGSIPNTKIFQNQLHLDNDGYIITYKKNLYTQTSVKGIFAAGDVMDKIYRQAITSSATGCMAALDAQNYLHDTIL
ncbi:thioredoxin-disulfide reductase [Enterobacteriaceae endosymbiont of Macroplea mutica]|uniref:thioredoxin-disulfide reductase n=1 Tax=Enterobacteriaceae endosymbiont of Macroplea mutica TaxID=2675791 RepID=UPI001449F92E|nr:thioredoxin-disulfide reductase [Enterobacteriaceae endosymbiont of Macroplea mutica]QJC31438.1 thioredoxin-disulfide reductase [Enterobacteriaceae endosymbiont of Macroplea mutica]